MKFLKLVDSQFTWFDLDVSEAFSQKKRKEKKMKLRQPDQHSIQ